MLKIEKPNVKIATLWSGTGGSTILLIELCNLFNKNNIPCEFYGPNDWHLNKCNGKLLSQLRIEKDDYFIGHLLDGKRFNLPWKNYGELLETASGLPCRAMRNKPKCRKAILYCHEKRGQVLRDNINNYDAIVFASNSQKEWHSYRGRLPQYVVPQPMCKFEKSQNPKKIAGIIGSIEERKQTHTSIDRALKDGCEKVLLYGRIRYDQDYYNQFVKHRLSDRVIYMGECPPEKRQQMYDSITCVYHSSLEESACLVEGECRLMGMPFHGNEYTIPYEIWSDEKIICTWKKIFRDKS